MSSDNKSSTLDMADIQALLVAAAAPSPLEAPFVLAPVSASSALPAGFAPLAGRFGLDDSLAIVGSGGKFCPACASTSVGYSRCGGPVGHIGWARI